MSAKIPARELDPEYMGAIARLPCLACAVRGVWKYGVQVAHLRAGSPEHGKPYTGKATKPSDRWTLPLCQPHHTGDRQKVRITQHHMDEVEFWQAFGINPFDACLALNQAYDAGKSLAPVLATIAANGRKNCP